MNRREGEEAVYEKVASGLLHARCVSLIMSAMYMQSTLMLSVLLYWSVLGALGLGLLVEIRVCKWFNTCVEFFPRTRQA